MQHLNDEVLARLVDEDPADDELLHLECCSTCAGELEGMREQVRALAGLPDLSPPPLLAARLRSGLAVEGLLLSTRSRRHAMLRTAASIALFAAGGLAGFIGRGATAKAPAPAPAAIASASLQPPATVAEATRRLQQAETAYTAALASYAELSGNPAADPVSRLAALEGIVLMTGAALSDAPADPVINGYHLTALEQRDALLRQIDSRSEVTEESEQEWY